jgi:hypothetical protein
MDTVHSYTALQLFQMVAGVYRQEKTVQQESGKVSACIDVVSIHRHNT